MRGTAILMVVFYHVYERTHFAFGVHFGNVRLSLRTVMQVGYLGVELFFFISGFCLMLPYAASLAGRRIRPAWSEYASRRFWKIVPSYYLALAVIALVFPFHAQPGISRWYDVFLHALFLHSFNAVSFPSLNGNFWSLAVEVQFYLLFPFIVWGFSRRPLTAAAGVTLVGALYSAFIVAIDRDTNFQWSFDLLSFLPLFGLGAACAYVYERWMRGAEFSQHVRAEFSAVAVTSLAVMVFLCDQLGRQPGGPPAWAWQNAHRLEIGLLLSIYSLAALAAPVRFQRAVSNRVLAFFSDISYNMYLWNAAIVAFVGQYWWADDGWRGGVFCVASVALTTAAGFILTRLLERPLMRNRWNSPRRAALALAALFRRPVRRADNG